CACGGKAGSRGGRRGKKERTGGAGRGPGGADMTTGHQAEIIRLICRAEGRAEARLSDGELLTGFIERRDGAAFEALVRRHGRMVWGACLRVLGNHHDAEDAFQATLLVLARKATSVAPRDRAGPRPSRLPRPP